MSYITVEEYYQHTNGGLDIIVELFPEAEKASREKNHKFSIRDERTPSATLYFNEGRKHYYVNDFGDKMYSPIDLVMIEQNLDFKGACRWIEQTFNIASKTLSVATSKPRPEYRKTDAEEEDQIGKRSWVIQEKPLLSHLKILFSKYVWSYLQKQDSKNDEQADDTAYRNAMVLLERYNLFVLESSSLVGRDKETGKKVVHTFYSTESYPIFMYNEGTWQKFYEPLKSDPSRRFVSYGDKPQNYMFGEARIAKMYANAQRYANGEDEDDVKLQDIIMCSGGSDALNVAALGFEVVWFNSETVKPWNIDIKKLKGWAHRVYNLPDIDATGKSKAFELALYHLDIHTIYLPDSLRHIKTGKFDDENRPKYCKDVRDYLNHYGANDFRNLLNVSYPFRFWNKVKALDSKGLPKIVEGKEVYKYSGRPKVLLNFLYRNGFAQIATRAGVFQYVRIDKNIVKSVTVEEIKEFIDNFLESIHAEPELLDAFIRSKDISESTFSRLPKITLEFKDHDRNTQFMFFKNEVWRVTKNDIEVIKAQKADRYVWENEVIKPLCFDEEGNDLELEVRRTEPFFKIRKDEEGDLVIDILRNDNPFLNFLINTSRIYWRNELEDNLDRSGLDKEAYRKKHQFSIAGPLLNPEQQKEQMQHLIAKLCAYGYFLHREKDDANTYCVWSLDYVMRDSEKSQGGTGKSIFGKSLMHLMQYETLDGREKDLTKNRHIYENVTEHTDYLLVDDGAKYLDFPFFFALVTTFMKVNPKGTKSYNLMFKDTPKLHISSNFPPMDSDDSTLRRLWFLAFSDYYHYNSTGEYREVRRPIDEFGKSLFQHFNRDEWNAFMNMAAQCIQAFMEYGKVEPPMSEIMANTYRNKLGPNFLQWANMYFQEDNETLNCYIPRYKIFETYKMEVSSDITAATFKDKLVMYCRMKNWTLNPLDAKHIQEDRRINIKCAAREVYDNKIKSWTSIELPKPQSIEHFYIQTPGTELTSRGLPEKKSLPF